MLPESLRIPCVAAILLDPAGRALLIQRDARPDLEFPGGWTLPGGRVEPGETPDAAIRREVTEELAITPSLVPWRVYDRPHHRPIDGRAVTVVQHVYTGRLTAREPITLGEGQAYAFHARAAIATLPVAYGFAHLLAEYLLERIP